MIESPPTVLRRAAFAALFAVVFLAAAAVLTGVAVFLASLVDPRYEKAVMFSFVVFLLLVVLGWKAQGTTRVPPRGSHTEDPGSARKGAALR